MTRTGTNYTATLSYYGGSYTLTITLTDGYTEGHCLATNCQEHAQAILHGMPDTL